MFRKLKILFRRLKAPVIVIPVSGIEFERALKDEETFDRFYNELMQRIVEEMHKHDTRDNRH